VNGGGRRNSTIRLSPWLERYQWIYRGANGLELELYANTEAEALQGLREFGVVNPNPSNIKRTERHERKAPIE
jgi:hypothetical protein